jgi:hypothetical protein
MKNSPKRVQRAKSTQKTSGTPKKKPGSAKRVPSKSREKSPTPKKPRVSGHGGSRSGAGRPSSALPAELIAQLRSATDADELLEALGECAALGIEGKLDRAQSKLLLEFSKEVRQGLKIKALEPRPSEIAEATEILTADEVEELERARAARRQAPLKPGDAPPPPPEESA